MSDPATASAKAAEATAKAVGQGLEIVHDTGGYLARVFADAPTDLVGVLGGAWLHERHIRLRDRLRRRTEQILRERDVKQVIELSPNVAAALIAGAQEEGRDELMELWARLLANAMDPNINSVRHSFIEAVKVMDPTDVLILQFLYLNSLNAIRRHQNEVGSATIEELAIRIERSPDDAEISLRHLLSLGFFDQMQVGNADWHMNAISRAFMNSCYPEAGM
jgi:hypothetical protein